MKRIRLCEVRSALIALDLLSQEDSDDLPDDKLRVQSFSENLKLDSLDFILLLERLIGADQLALVDVSIWDCLTVQDLINFHKRF